MCVANGFPFSVSNAPLRSLLLEKKAKTKPSSKRMARVLYLAPDFPPKFKPVFNSVKRNENSKRVCVVCSMVRSLGTKISKKSKQKLIGRKADTPELRSWESRSLSCYVCVYFSCANGRQEIQRFISHGRWRKEIKKFEGKSVTTASDCVMASKELNCDTCAVLHICSICSL